MKKTAVLMCAFLCAAGCGVYEPVEIIPDHLQSIRIEPVRNETSQIGISSDLTQELIDEFIREGRFTVTSSPDADAILYTTVASYSQIPLSYDENFVVQEYKIAMVANLRFIDNVEKLTLWQEKREGFSGGIEAWVNYSVSPEVGITETEEEARERLIENLAQRILQRTVYGWD